MTTAIHKPTVSAMVRPTASPSELWGPPERHLVALLRPDSFEAAQYRALAHRLEREAAGHDLRTIAVCSPGSGEGKTLTTINFAATVAQHAPGRVLLIDADLRRPAVARRLGLRRRAAGLGELLQNPEQRLEQHVLRYRTTQLDVLPAGLVAGDPYSALSSPVLARLFEEAKARYARVLVDTPPLLPVPDWRVLERQVDGFLLVVTARATDRQLLAEALDALSPDKFVGLVFNRDDGPLNRYYHQYRDYYQSKSSS